MNDEVRDLWRRCGDGLVAAAQLTLHYRLLFVAYLLCLCLMFFTDPNVTSRFVLYYFLLPTALVAMMVTAAGRPIGYATLLWACVIYLAALALASWVQPDTQLRAVWQQVRLSLAVLLFLWATAFLMMRYRNAAAWLVTVVGIALALSAAINIYLFFTRGAPGVADPTSAGARLVATIGMPAYTNSTNISATYAVYFAGLVGVSVQRGTPRAARLVAALAAAVLLAGVALTESRSAYLAVAASLLVVVLASPRRLRVVVGGLALCAGVALAARPGLIHAILVRGAGNRFDVWSYFGGLIRQRPLFGYGALDRTTGFTLEGQFLDQAHNLVLSGWFRGGILAALAMAFVLLGGLYWANRYRIATGGLVPLCVIVAIATAGMFDYQLLVTYPTWPWATFWLPFGLCIGAEVIARQQARSPGGSEPA
jgi:hypothetical protein